MSSTSGYLVMVDEFQRATILAAAQLDEAPTQVEDLRTPVQRALDILAPHLANEPLYRPNPGEAS